MSIQDRFNTFRFSMKIGLGVLLLFGLTACQGSKHLSDLDEDYILKSGTMRGYLTLRELPNSLALLPPPPEEGSLALQLDEGINAALFKVKDSVRWIKATQDANLVFPEAIASFEEIIGISITADTTPYLYLLLQRTLTDAAFSTLTAKTHYKRKRPYKINGESTCTPELEELMKDGSYPSGHAAIGFAWGLILTEIFPEQTNKLIYRGREFGESRAVCNVHWHSDVIEGRFMGAATVACLHGNKNFMADLDRAKQEVKSLMEK